MPNKNISAGNWTAADIDETENTYRARVRNPNDFEEGSFRVTNISDGINLTVGKLQGQDTTIAQSYVFDKEKFDKSQVVDWLNKEKVTAKMSGIQDTLNFAQFPIPKDAYVPETELWVEILKTGTWFPGNTPGQDFSITEEDLVLYANGTKAAIAKDMYPSINIDHDNRGETLGLLKDVRVDGDKLLAQIGYFTNKTKEALNRGEFPFRSAELNLRDNRISGLALLGHDPAIEGMQLSPMNLSKADNGNYIFFSKNNLNKDKKKEAPMPDEIMKFKAELEKKEAELAKFKADNEKLLKEKENEKKEFSAKQQELENDMKMLQTSFNDLSKTSRLDKLTHDYSQVKIPGYTADQLAECHFSIEKGSVEVLKFSKNDGKIEEFSPAVLFHKVVTDYSSMLKRMGSSEIDIHNTQKPVNIFKSGTPENEAAFDAEIKKFAASNKISYAEAYEKLTSDN